MAPILHCVRHAQGFHNLNNTNHSIRDPLLTPFGEGQCSALATNFPSHDKIELVIASPMKRTLYTALLGFGQDIERIGKPIIAIPELQETSDLPCDTGSSPEDIAREFAGKPVDLGLVKPGWNSKQLLFAPTQEAIELRAKQARLWLMSRPEKEIVVVTHGTAPFSLSPLTLILYTNKHTGGFLHYFTEEWAGSSGASGTGWANTEYRSYTFSSADPAGAHLVETPESLRRRMGNDKPLDGSEQTQLKRTAMMDWMARGYIQNSGAAAKL